MKKKIRHHLGLLIDDIKILLSTLNLLIFGKQ